VALQELVTSHLVGLQVAVVVVALAIPEAAIAEMMAGIVGIGGILEAIHAEARALEEMCQPEVPVTVVVAMAEIVPKETEIEVDSEVAADPEEAAVDVAEAEVADAAVVVEGAVAAVEEEAGDVEAEEVVSRRKS
jgi:hypothetical protein